MEISLLERIIKQNPMLKILYDKTLEIKAKSILELGVSGGWSTRTFLCALDKTEGKLTSVDILYCYSIAKVVDEINLTHRWNFIQADDLYIDFQEKFDLIYIDTSHYYEQTFAELEKYTKLLNDKGIILLHDFHFDKCSPIEGEINRFLDVKNAVRIFIAKQPEWKVIDLLPLDSYGMGMMWKDV